MKKKLDIIYLPDIDALPKIVLTIKKFNHVYFGLYKGFDNKTFKEVKRYFWAEHDDVELFFRCLVTEDLKTWTLDAISNSLIPPFPITSLQKDILIDIDKTLLNLLNKDGLVLDKYKTAVEKYNSPLLILKENDDSSEFSEAEINILNTLNKTWRLDASLLVG